MEDNKNEVVEKEGFWAKTKKVKNKIEKTKHSTVGRVIITVGLGLITFASGFGAGWLAKDMSANGGSDVESEEEITEE